MTHKKITWVDGRNNYTTLAVQAWTDYPFALLGDESGKEAPIRKCWVLAWDGAGWPHIMVEMTGRGYQLRTKLCYLYQEPGRCGEVKTVSRWALRDRRNRPAWQFLRRRYTKTTYQFYWLHDSGAEMMDKFDTFADMQRFVSGRKLQGEAWYWRTTEHHNGGSESEHERCGDTYEEAPTFCFPIKRRRKGRK